MTSSNTCRIQTPETRPPPGRIMLEITDRFVSPSKCRFGAGQGLHTAPCIIKVGAGRLHFNSGDIYRGDIYRNTTSLNMSFHNVLITGASGYLGGTLLARWQAAQLPPYGELFALVRTDAQAEGVKQYGAQPLKFDSKDETAVKSAIVDNQISIVYYLIDALRSEAQVYFIKALADVKKLTGKEVHFLHVRNLTKRKSCYTWLAISNYKQTTGAKIFSSHAGAPTDRPLLDTEEGLYYVQKTQKAPLAIMQTVRFAH